MLRWINDLFPIRDRISGAIIGEVINVPAPRIEFNLKVASPIIQEDRMLQFYNYAPRDAESQMIGGDPMLKEPC